MNRVQVGKNIRNRRKELKLTQAQLAELAQISVVHVSHIETATATMSLDCFIALCQALRTTPNELLLGEYIYPNVEKMLVKEANHKPALDKEDTLLLQNIYQFLESRRKK